MLAHHDFTSAFDAGLKGAALPPGMTATAPDETARRFAVYANNVAFSLSEALAKRFPVIRRLVGNDFFAAMARVYADAHRPTSPVLLEWGETFPAFLAAFPPLADYPYMADVALIEVARGQAFHAADAVPAKPDSFLGANPSSLHLVLHPSVRVLRLRHPGVTIWARNQPGEAPQAMTLAGEEIALILRDRAFNVSVIAISDGDAVMIDHIRLGASLTTAAELALWSDPDHDPQPLILRLMQTGAILDPKEIR
ncbi:MAG: DUF2063 domain-containing protein [Paracoccaceae bacterium]